MVGRTNHFKHSPRTGLAVFFLARCVLLGFHLALTLLLFVINAPWILIPAIGIACWIYRVRQNSIHAQEAVFTRELKESSEQLSRKLEERHRELEAYFEESRRRDQEIVDQLAKRRLERKPRVTNRTWVSNQ